MKFKVGDKVKIIRNNNGSERCVGETHKIIESFERWCYPYTLDGTGATRWCDDELELVKSKMFELKDLKPNHILTLRNGYIVMKIYLGDYGVYNKNLEMPLNSNYDIMEIWEFDKCVWKREETKKEILDEVEKKYLSSVIRPFRKDVSDIVKKHCPDGYYIAIIINDEEPTFLPYFKNELMYKSMKIGKRYTLEELGL